MKPTLVVISHYNAWATDQLISLLDQMDAIPSGHPFRRRVVVNQAIPKPLQLPDRFADVEVLYRENLGYNIGAWEEGWRCPSEADEFLFLQEECQILSLGWLSAFHKQLNRAKVGLVGESLIWRGFRWSEVDGHDLSAYGISVDRIFPSLFEEGRMLTLPQGVLEVMNRRGIPAGASGEHLQSLILGSRREVLEAAGGFIVGRSKAEANAAEVAISRAVAAKGYQVRQVAVRPFSYISHPQWDGLRGGKLTWLRGCVDRYLPDPLANGLRKSMHRLKKWK